MSVRDPLKRELKGLPKSSKSSNARPLSCQLKVILYSIMAAVAPLDNSLFPVDGTDPKVNTDNSG